MAQAPQAPVAAPGAVRELVLRSSGTLKDGKKENARDSYPSMQLKR